MSRLRPPSYFEHAGREPTWDVLEWPDIAVGERPMSEGEAGMFHVARRGDAVFERVTESEVRAMGARTLQAEPKGRP